MIGQDIKPMSEMHDRKCMTGYKQEENGSRKYPKRVQQLVFRDNNSNGKVVIEGVPPIRKIIVLPWFHTQNNYIVY